MYPHPRGFPSRSALKVLSEKFLHRKIQTGAHDSAADAQAAMDLVKLKLKHGQWKFWCAFLHLIFTVAQVNVFIYWRDLKNDQSFPESVEVENYRSSCSVYLSGLCWNLWHMGNACNSWFNISFPPDNVSSTFIGSRPLDQVYTIIWSKKLLMYDNYRVLYSGPDFAEGDMARRLTHTVKLVEVLHNDQVRCCLVDRKHILSSHSFAATDVVPVDSDAEAEAAVIKRMQTGSQSKFVWTQFQELGRFYFQR